MTTKDYKEASRKLNEFNQWAKNISDNIILSRFYKLKGER